MSKHKFTLEFPIHASPKMLFPYLATSQGLSTWVADKVTEEENIFSFIWDGAAYKAKKVSQKLNQYVKFEFLQKPIQEKTDSPFIEMELSVNDITQTAFLKITDYSEIEDPNDVTELWNHNIKRLKEKIGG